jgi:hypothetical protein
MKLTRRGYVVAAVIWLSLVVTFTYLTRDLYVTADWRPQHSAGQ